MHLVVTCRQCLAALIYRYRNPLTNDNFSVRLIGLQVGAINSLLLLAGPSKQTKEDARHAQVNPSRSQQPLETTEDSELCGSVTETGREPGREPFAVRSYNPIWDVREPIESHVLLLPDLGNW